MLNFESIIKQKNSQLAALTCSSSLKSSRVISFSKF